MRWIWVRHGETEANVRGCYLGHLDSALTSQGYEQAQIVAERTAEVVAEVDENTVISELQRNLKSTRLYTSDLGRCMETAGIIARRLGLEVTSDSRLRELDFGQWEGMTYSEVMKSDQALMSRWYDNPFDIAPLDGETLSQLGQRVDNWMMQTIDELHAEDTVIVVTHGGPIRWFQSRWLLRDAASYWKVEAVPTGSMIIVEYIRLNQHKFELAPTSLYNT